MGFFSLRFVLRILAILSWVISIVWLIDEPDFEPLLAFLAGTMAFLGSFVASDAPISSPLFSTQTSFQDERNRNRLLRKIEIAWIQGVLEPSLGGLGYIDLSTVYRLDAVARPSQPIWEPYGGAYSEVIPSTEIADVFQEADGALLILGEPGAGKTIMLLELAKQALTQAEQDARHPIPVVLPLSSWEEGITIEKWLVNELAAQYRVPAKMTMFWLESNSLLLLFDSFDEVSADHRPACITAVNEFRQKYGPDMVVCSRTDAYISLPERFSLIGAVELQPLTPAQLDAYLSTNPGLDNIREAIGRDEELHRLARTPLMLQIMKLAYANRSGHSLGTERPSSIQMWRRYLFDTYVNYMFSRGRRTNTRYTQQQSLHRLSWLARNMVNHHQTVFLLERMQPSWLSTRSQRWSYVFISRFLGSLILGLLAGFYLTSLRFGLLVVLAGTLGVGLVDGLRLNRMSKARSAASVFTIRSLIINVVRVWLVTWAFFVLLNFLYIVLFIGFRRENVLDYLLLRSVLEFFVAVIAIGSVVGLVFGLVFGLRGSRQSATIDIRPVEKIRLSWRSSRRGASTGLIIGFIFGAFMAFFPWLGGVLGIPESSRAQDNLVPGDIIILVLGMIAFGLVFGLAGGIVGVILSALGSATVETKVFPNQGIWLSARNAMLGCLSGMILGLLVGLAWDPYSGLVTGLLLGSLAFLWYGGLDVIQHATLYFVLYLSGSIPWNFTSFLDYFTKLVFLQKVGGGYIFIHRLMMEHFAGLKSE